MNKHQKDPQLAALDATQVSLQFHLAQLGHNCRVAINGQTIRMLRRFTLETSYDSATTVTIQGILDTGSEIFITGQLLVTSQSDELPNLGEQDHWISDPQ